MKVYLISKPLILAQISWLLKTLSLRFQLSNQPVIKGQHPTSYMVWNLNINHHLTMHCWKTWTHEANYVNVKTCGLWKFLQYLNHLAQISWLYGDWFLKLHPDGVECMCVCVCVGGWVWISLLIQRVAGNVSITCWVIESKIFGLSYGGACW